MRRVSVPTDRIAVVGAGASALVLDLAAGGYRTIEAVDISAAALRLLCARLGSLAASVHCLCTDVRRVAFATQVDVWHDRATFHFLTDPADQRLYAGCAAASVAPGGYLVMATFSDRGPEQCSGLPVTRHSVASLVEVFAPEFDLVESFELDHTTPWGAPQSFLHAVFHRRADPAFDNALSGK